MRNLYYYTKRMEDYLTSISIKRAYNLNLIPIVLFWSFFIATVLSIPTINLATICFTVFIFCVGSLISIVFYNMYYNEKQNYNKYERSNNHYVEIKCEHPNDEKRIVHIDYNNSSYNDFINGYILLDLYKENKIGFGKYSWNIAKQEFIEVK